MHSTKEPKVGFIRFRSCFITSLAVIGTFLVLWPTITLGLDSHHDGLVIATINMTKLALFHGGDLPFNQYGPLWAFTYAVLSLPFSTSHTLIAARIITLIIYLLTIFIAFKITKSLKVTNLWSTMLIIIFLTQPWTTGNVSTFLAWPSALSMFLLTLVAYSVVKIQNKTKIRLNVFSLGILVALIIFTRFQIGVLSFLLSLLFLFSLKRFDYLIRFSMSFSVAVVSICLILYQKGWLQFFISDVIEYGLTYVQNKYDFNPIPKFTFLISGFVFFVLITTERHTRNRNAEEVKPFNLKLVLPVIAATLLLSTLIVVSPGFQERFTLITRRLWIGCTLGVILFYASQIFLKSKSRLSSIHLTQSELWLFLFGGVGMIQLYPLFDQMHFWWGLSPIVIPLTMLLSRLLARLQIDLRVGAFMALIMFGTTNVIIPSIRADIAEAQAYTGNIASLIRVSPDVNAERAELQAFFRDSISRNSKVANLCHNPDIFLDSTLAHSSSRYFIYWPPFTSIAEIRTEIEKSHPEIVVTCNQTHVPAAAEDVKNAQNQLLQFFRVDLQNSLKATIDGTTWSVYRR